MPDLVLELYSEDIPAWMQDSAVRTLAPRIVKELEDAGVSSEKRESFVTPRRLALIVSGLPAVQPARTGERKGPRVSAPDKAIEGFLRSAGVQSVGDLETRDDGKGEFYVAVTREDERPLAALLAEKIPGVLREFPWAKSMRWGDGAFRWARPLRSILCIFDGKVVPFEVAGIAAGNVTRGHPVMSPEAITIGGAEDYQKKLEKAHVHLERAARRQVIRDRLATVAKKHGVDLVQDDGLIAETAGQVEWPVVLSGGIDARFMDLPEELLISVMRGHQQNFAFRDKKTGKLAPLFAAVADVEASGGGKAIIAGNEAVLRARFADAQFYWEVDCRVSLEEHKEKAGNMSFHGLVGKIGGDESKIERIIGLIDFLHLSNAAADEAAPFLKSDLATRTVQEFPELQGIAGYYLALKHGWTEESANVIKEHYAPTGQSDAIPTSVAGRSVALADKLDTLICFFAIGLKPTGSGDPHGLRRAALGVLRIMLEGKVDFPLREMIQAGEIKSKLDINAYMDIRSGLKQKHKDKNIDNPDLWERPSLCEVEKPLLDFMAERLKVHLRNNRGMPHDVIDAVLFPSEKGKGEGIDSPRHAVLLMEALAKFLSTDDGANLLAGYKRAANILRIEEKKDGNIQYAPTPDSDLLQEEAEKTLAKALEVAEKDTAITPDQDDFAAAMTALAKLRQPLDAFFDSVTVNDSDKNLRANRLELLSQVRKVMHQVADFSRIEGGERKQS